MVEELTLADGGADSGAAAAASDGVGAVCVGEIAKNPADPRECRVAAGKGDAAVDCGGGGGAAVRAS